MAATHGTMVARMNLSIDINADLGELDADLDAAMMPFISSASIACGFHAGDPDTMRATVRLAKERGVAFGAHPDDCELQLGGTAARWAAAGHHVLLVSVTNGDIGHWREAGGPLALRRKAEVDAAHRILGIQGVVLDNHDGELKAWENLYIYGRYFGLSRAFLKKKVEELLEFAQLTEKRDVKVDQLSGGMKRRLTIARGLVNEPEILMLDEPTTGLDPQARHILWDRLFRLKEEGVTLVITTHYMDEAEQLCDRLIVMDKGKIMAEGSPAALIKKYSSKEVLEVRFGSKNNAEAAKKIAHLGDRIEPLPDRILVYSEDGERVLKQIHKLGLEPQTSLVRRSSLEDVFLRLTGRTLVD